MKIPNHIYWGRNWVIMIWSKLLIFFGFKYSNKFIPEGMYCYTPDIEKNNDRENFSVYYIKPCKYYKSLSRDYNGCMYLGIITDDLVFNDQCKLCSDNL